MFDIRFRDVSLIFAAMLLLALPMSAGAQTVNFNTVPVGQSSAVTPVTLTFPADSTPASLIATAQGATGQDFAIVSGGSCGVGVNVAAGHSCTANVTFTPKFAGERMGAVAAEDAGGDVLATTYVSGVGSGPQVGFQGLNQPLRSLSNLGITTDKGIAVDGNGNIFVSSLNSTTTKESVVEVPAGCTQASCLKQLPGSFEAVWGLAVDGAGNLWVGDWGANGSITEIPAAGGYSTLKTYSGSFGNQIGVAVDGSGNVLFGSARPGYADSVMELTAASGYTTVETLADNINIPGGVALDASGDVFYIDSMVAGIKEIVAVNGSIPASPTIKTVGNGVTGPQYLVVDGSGNLIVTANGGLIYEVLADGGYTTVNKYSNQLSDPTGIAEDEGGNLYISDFVAGYSIGGVNVPARDWVYEIVRGATPSLTFATPTAPGEADTADGAQKVSLQNLGNESLDLSGLALSSANFTLDPSTTTCTPTTALAAGDGCTLGVLFTPTATGNPITGTLTLTDNSLNGTGAQQNLPLTGSGLYTPAIHTSGSWLVAVSQPLNLTITVQGGSGNPTPTGTVQLNATGSAGSPVTLANGSAAVTIPANTLSVGQVPFSIQYQPDAASAAIYVPVLGGGGDFTVTSTLMNVPSITVAPVVTSISAGQALTVNVTVNQVNGAPVPTGTVTLASGNYSAPATALVGGTTSFTIPANSLTIGTDLLVASYTPDAASANIYLAATGGGFVAVSAAPPPAGAAPVDFGSLGIGKTSAVTPVTLSFPAGGTPASLIATTQGATGLDFAIVSGGSCGAGVNVAAQQSCTVNVTFTPGFAGLRSGAVAALDANGQTLAMTYIYGTGTGAKLDITSTRFYSVSLENQYPPDFYASSTTAISDGFGRPNVTVDGAGNLFVADWANNAVKEIPAGCTSSACTVVVVNGVYAPTAVAVDGAGNLFVTESAYGDVKKISVGCQSSSCMETVGTGFNQPYGLYVDASGNVYVADTFNNAIKEVVAAGGYTTINTLATGLDLPWSVVVNAAGDLFVAEGGDQCQPWIPGSCSTINTSLLQITAASGYKTVNTLSAGGFGKPLGLAIDGAGNVYDSDYGNICSWEWTAGSGYATTESWCATSASNSFLFFLGSESLGVQSNGDIYFADVNSGKVYQTVFNAQPAMVFRTAVLAGSTDYEDGAQSIFLMNNGNAPWTVTAMTLSDASIKFDSTYTTCSTAKPIPAGGECFVAVDFAPVTPGPHNSTLTLTGSDSNGSSTWTIPITATALPPAPTILTTPANPTTTGSAAFTFSDTQSPVTFVCSIDGLPYAACSSPQNYSALSGGAHAFQVKAVDTQGNVSLAAVYNWTVNTVGPPAPTITSAPASIGNADTATFAFTDARAGVSYLCSRDGAAFAACSSGVSYSGLSLPTGGILTKWHSFAVEAQDSAGNVSPEATWTWMCANYGVSSSPVNFGALPVGQSSAPQTVTFTFSAADTIAAIKATTMGITGLDYTVSDPGTCAVGTAVSSGSTCTLKAIFTPMYAGQRKGGLVLLDSAGTGIGEAYLEGAGTAPQVIFTPYSTLWYNMLPPQNNPDPKMNLSSSLTDAAVDGAGDLYVTEAARTNAYANESGSTQAVVVNVGALWEIPVGCTTSPCTKLLAAAEDSGGQYSSTSVLIPYGLVMDGTGELWIANSGFGLSVLSTVGSTDSRQCLYFDYGSSAYSYMKRVGVDGGGICSFLSYFGGLFVDGSQVGVPGQAAAIGAAAPAIEHKPDAVGGGGYSGPSFDFSTNTTSMTVDPQGNIWVADAGNNAIKEVLASSNFTVDRTILTGLNNPNGVTSDALGNIYVADAGNNALKEITAASGYTQVVTIATFDPKVLALGNFTIDAGGNFYLANQSSSGQLQNQLAKLDFADAPPLNFPTQTLVGAIDSTDGTLTATVKNNGNMPLNIGGLAVSNTNFQIDAGATTCSTSAPLPAGASCMVGVFFSPTANGALTGTLTLTDNALNQTGAAQNFALTGTGYTKPTTSTPTVTVAPTSATITTAQSDQVMVTVSGASGGATPTGAVTLSSGNYSSVAMPLSAGSATFTVPAGVLALGSDTVVAMYTPDTTSAATYGSGASSATVTVTAVPKSTPTVSVTPSMIDVSTAQSLPVTITVSGGSGSPTPTGSVTLSGGNYASLATVLSNGSATITIPAGYLPAGSVTLTAYYTPDPAGQANYTSASGTGLVAVEAAAKTTPAVTVTPASTSLIATQALQVTMAVSGDSGNSVPTGSVVLSGGGYTSAAARLSNGSVILSIPAGTLAIGSNTLSANYTPDNASALTYNSATGSNTVAVTAPLTAQTIAFANPGAQTVGTPLTLSATATSSLAVSFTSTTASICTVSGTQAAFLAPGICTIDATQAGNSTYAAAAMVAQSFTVNGEAQTITFGTIAAQTVGTPLTLSATATSSLAVTFASTTTSVCTLSGTQATFLTTGTCTIDANQGGNSTYAAAPQVQQSFTVNAAPVPATFTVTSPTAPQTLQPGGTASYTINVNPVNGSYTGAVTLSVVQSTLPAGATAHFSSNPVRPGTTGTTSTLSIQTAAQTGYAMHSGWPLAAPALALIGLFLVPDKRRRRWLTLGVLLLASLSAFTAFSACGGGFSAGTHYAITVNGANSSGVIVSSTTVELTVQ